MEEDIKEETEISNVHSKIKGIINTYRIQEDEDIILKEEEEKTMVGI